MSLCALLYLTKGHKGDQAYMRQRTSKELVHVSAYISKDLHKELLLAAEQDKRSVSSEISVLLEMVLLDKSKNRLPASK